jgi:hypothetical protein
MNSKRMQTNSWMKKGGIWGGNQWRNRNPEKSQIEILEMKNSITYIKNSVESLINILIKLKIE